MLGIIIAIILVALVAFGFASYNGLVKKRNLVQEAWRQIDVELKRRHDLIPNLVETVKGYAQHERSTLDDVIRARNAAMSGSQTPEQATQNETQLSGALSRLVALSEAYPDLKANANFTSLQQELAATEDRIASGRRYYNATVRDLNTAVDSVPTNFFANMAGIKKETYFEAEPAAVQAPTIDFGQGSGTIAGPGQGGQGYPQGGGQAAYPQVGGPQQSFPQPGYPAQTPQSAPIQQPADPTRPAGGDGGGNGMLRPPQV